VKSNFGGDIIDVANCFAEYWHFNKKKSIIIRFYEDDAFIDVRNYNVSPSLSPVQVKLFVENRLNEVLPSLCASDSR